MRIDRITVKAAATVPTAMYANVRPEIELSATLAPEDDYQECMDALQHSAAKALLDYIASLQEAV